MPGTPRTILLVAGPSGSGKSTFIQCLRRGRLPEEIRKLLPNAASAWPHFEANDFVKRGIAVDSVLSELAPNDGLILHFAIAFGRRYGVIDYSRDPAAHLMQMAHRLVIANILPSPERLGEQFERRLAERERRRGVARRLWRRFVRLPARSLVRQMTGQILNDTSRIYRNADELRRAYDEWSAFARSLVATKPGSRILLIEPRSGRGREPAFAINGSWSLPEDASGKRRNPGGRFRAA